MVAMTLKAIDEGIRLPDGLAIAYPPLRVQYTPSPSRILSLMDPLLPPGILKLCLRAYAGDVHTDKIPQDTGGSYKSLRSFEHTYNPFDVDLGDSTGRANWVSVTGQRSYSDSNLMASKSASYCRQNNMLVNNSPFRKTSNVRLEESNDDEPEGLQMHPIPPAKIQGDCIRETENHSSENGAGKIDVPGAAVIKESANNDFSSHRNEAKCDSVRALGVNKHSGEASIDNHCEAVASKVDATNIGIAVRDSHANKKSFSHHRRSMSDGMAQSFNRLRPKSGESPNGFYQGTNEYYRVHERKITEKSSSSESMEFKSCNSGRTKSENEERSISNKENVHGKREYSAVYVKESSDCLILEKEDNSTALSDFHGKTGDTTRSEGSKSSSDSITSSIQRRSRDPFMSPLLASDDLLLQMPQLLIVACTFDPLLDDSVEFTRRLLKLNRRAELFIVDDLPHGFLNFHFASSEARDASDLLVACIKRILAIGVKHQSSFPVSPDVVPKSPEWPR